MRPEHTARLEELSATLTSIEKVMDPEAVAERVRELEAQAGDPTLWDDPDHAQKVTSALSAEQAKLRKLSSLRGRIEDLPVMAELAEEEGDEASKELVATELEELGAAIESLEVTTMLSGEYDEREAVINIRSGAGGVDAAAVRRADQHAGARLGQCHGARCRLGLGGTRPAIRHAAAVGPGRAGDPLCAPWLPGLADHRRTVAQRIPRH